MPGPGNYTPDLKNSKINAPLWKFGTSHRTDKNPLIENPGPGNYNYLQAFGSQAPKYSLTAKNYYKGDTLKVPGPGQYESNKTNYTSNKPPTWKIGTSTREDNLKQQMRENFPGPGNYSNKSETFGPKYSFNHDKRAKTPGSINTPGPGQYKIPTTIFNVPNFSSGNWDPNFKFV